MARTSRRRSKDPSLLDSALNGKWQVSAFLAGLGLLITAVVLPLTLGSHKLLGPLAGMFQTLGWVFTGIFALIAVVKLAAKTVPSQPNAFDLAEQGSNVVPFQKPARIQPSVLKPAECLTTWSLELLRQIEWKRFEELVAAYFREAGYRVETIRCGADGGVDAKIYRDGNLIAIVQCKAWNTRLVGVKPVRELLGVMTHQQVPHGIFMATGEFTDEARDFAKSNPLTLVTGEALLKEIAALPVEAQQRLLAVATEGDYRTPTCPSCGVKMVERTGKEKPFWGCQNYPRCRQTFAQAW